MHQFEATTNWLGGLDGVGKLQTSSFESVFSAPYELQGRGAGTNPEELLLCASATCYLITLAVILDRLKVPVRVRLRSEVLVGMDKGPQFKKIRHFPTLCVSKKLLETAKSQLEESLRKAELFCMVSKALKGNVEIEVISAFDISDE